MGQTNKKLYKSSSQKYYVKGDAKVERKMMRSEALVKAVALAFYPFYLAINGAGKLVKRLKSTFKNDSTHIKADTAKFKLGDKSVFGEKLKSIFSNGASYVKSSFEAVKKHTVPFVQKNKWAVSGVTAVVLLASVTGVVLLKAGESKLVEPVVATEQATTHKVGAVSSIEAKAKELEFDTSQVTKEALAKPKLPEFKVMSAASARVNALVVNGSPVAYFKSENEAKELLNQVKARYGSVDEKSNREVVDTYFYEDVQVEETYLDIMDFSGYDTVDGAMAFISNGSREKKTHVVAKGENFWSISAAYGIGVSELEAANPQVKPELLQIGMEVNLVVAKPLISVCTVERASFTEQLAFEVVYEESSNLFKGEQRTKVDGAYGERVVTAEIIKQNGKEIARKTLSEEVKSEPKTKVVYKGTKNPPPRVGSGVLSRPVSYGGITSPFGPRGRGRHLGVDIGVSSGTPVMAADGGTVVYAGWGDSYGYYVIIDHGSNMTTLYAHNSKLAVQRGQKVHKGQVVSYSGNTGNSYGAHLHFEVRINGVHRNPINYVRF